MRRDRQQRNICIGSVALEHDIPDARGAIVDDDRFIVAHEKRSIVVVSRRRQGALSDVEIAVAGPTGDADLQRGRIGQDRDLVELLAVGRSEEARHGGTAGQRDRHRTGRIGHLQRQAGVVGKPLEHDIPSSRLGTFNGDALFAAHFIRPIIIGRGRGFRILAHVEVTIARTTRNTNDEVILPLGNDDGEELLASHRPGNATDRNAACHIETLSQGRRSQKTNGSTKDQSTRPARSARTLHPDSSLNLTIPPSPVPKSWAKKKFSRSSGSPRRLWFRAADLHAIARTTRPHYTPQAWILP